MVSWEHNDIQDGNEVLKQLCSHIFSPIILNWNSCNLTAGIICFLIEWKMILMLLVQEHTWEVPLSMVTFMYIWNFLTCYRLKDLASLCFIPGWTRAPLFSWMNQFFIPWQRNTTKLQPWLPFATSYSVGLWPSVALSKKSESKRTSRCWVRLWASKFITLIHPSALLWQLLILYHPSSSILLSHALCLKYIWRVYPYL